MWLPSSFVPSWVAGDASARHLVARLSCSAGAFALVGLMPHATEVLASATGSHCLMQAWLGCPCPGCGITTSLQALAGGDVMASLGANPAGIVVAAVLGGQALLSVVGLWRRRGPNPEIHRWLERLDRILAGGLGAVWAARIVGPWL